MTPVGFPNFVRPALRAGGMKVERAEVAVDGKLNIIVDRNGKEETRNPWDEVLIGFAERLADDLKAAKAVRQVAQPRGRVADRARAGRAKSRRFQKRPVRRPLRRAPHLAR